MIDGESLGLWKLVGEESDCISQRIDVTIFTRVLGPTQVLLNTWLLSKLRELTVIWLWTYNIPTLHSLSVSSQSVSLMECGLPPSPWKFQLICAVSLEPQ